ncbi:MAG: ATP-grasp domain-containing protein [Candidatus Dormibacteria bacterium]
MRAGAAVVFVGPNPLPAMASGLPAICQGGCGLSHDGRQPWSAFPQPRGRSTRELLRHPEVQARLRQSFEGLLTWKSSAEIEAIAHWLGLALANSPARLARRIENKAFFAESAPAAGLPLPPTRAGRAGDELVKACRELKPPLVFQLAHGFSGASTWRAREWEELMSLMEAHRGRSCRVSQEVFGVPVTVTGVVQRERTLVGAPSLQLTGIPALTPHPLGSCGNDHLAPVPEQAAVAALAERCGDWLRQLGHLGVFGLDLVVDAGQIWCIEVNPRLVASVPLFSLSASARSLPGLLDHHLASFGLGRSKGDIPPCDWSQLILYARAERAFSGEVEARTGRLTRVGRFQAEGRLNLDGPRPGQTGIVVQAQSRPGQELARVFHQGRVTGEDGALLPALEQLCHQLRAELEPEGVSPA